MGFTVRPKFTTVHHWSLCNRALSGAKFKSGLGSNFFCRGQGFLVKVKHSSDNLEK